MTELIAGTHAFDWITRFTHAFGAAQQALTDLDRLAGDGDFGTNIASALRRTSDALPDRDIATFGTVFGAMSRGFLATGGTSGPLFGMCFRDISRSASADGANVVELAAGVASGLATIQKLGGAKVGDNTMIDALAPASDALTAAADDGATLGQAFAAAAAAARVGAESTGDLVASRGRASYVGELARGVLDPGAVTIALFFESGAATIGVVNESELLAWLPAAV
ncbi:dihydroxyacetone kinase subunit DhaL [Schumannella soli]|uniref:Dihydroxyacetone kinase subunit L n=1 Tax=Schumannella soli TaxID=2590779 RepID=A0A506Y9T3_9MICO|nr:dihydroxyacetone kinase subunit DhaL [Schumannella soli]TPW77867.1 dihydroxyacetone kinase subunit L [Schumannella soli]